MVLRLSIKSMGTGYTQSPKDCVISARAISGLIEQEELKKSIQRIEDHKSKLSNDINQTLSTSGTMFCGKRDILSNSDTWKTISATMEYTNTHNATNTNSPASPSKVPAITLPITESDLELDSDYKTQSKFQSRQEQLKRHDPVSSLLASTFLGSNTSSVLDKSIAKLHGSKSNRRLSRKDMEEMDALGVGLETQGSGNGNGSQR